jgi:hypothetical protein
VVACFDVGAGLAHPACNGSDHSGNTLWVHGDGACGGGLAGDAPARRLVVVVSLGLRPWVEPLVLPRLRAYAARVSADLLLLRALPRCSAGGDGNGCAKLAKLRAAHAALTPHPEEAWSLGRYGRVAVVDDTILLRADAPNVFAMVPPAGVGATVEDARVRPAAESATLSRLALLKEAGTAADELLLSSDTLDTLVASGRLTLPSCVSQRLRDPAEPADDRRFFNSGLLVLSSAHACLLANLPLAVDLVVLWDQGLVNARRRLAGAPLHDLGLTLNWVGSFNGSNAHQRPCDAADAFAVHATTGVGGNPA